MFIETVPFLTNWYLFAENAVVNRGLIETEVLKKFCQFYADDTAERVDLDESIALLGKVRNKDGYKNGEGIITSSVLYIKRVTLSHMASMMSVMTTEYPVFMAATKSGSFYFFTKRCPGLKAVIKEEVFPDLEEEGVLLCPMTERESARMYTAKQLEWKGEWGPYRGLKTRLIM